jgi:S-adenosylmethionine:tRNA ribosyltransferase-isomerase
LTAETPLRTADFEYDLPPELIAQHPSARRGESRLLLARRGSGEAGKRVGELHDSRFTDLLDLIPPGDLLVLNSTRVRHARLLGARASGAPAEVLLLHPAVRDCWLAIGKPGHALRPGRRIRLGGGVEIDTVEVLEGGERVIRAVGATMEDAIARFGRLPLPPYIDREPDATDEVRYQTVYAEREGSVAAPTAGLHFTGGLLTALRARGVRVETLDLEVGPGTFRPVETERISEHSMHPERFDIPDQLAHAVGETRDRGSAIWAVGTTVVRALESAARHDGSIVSGTAETRLLIAPGYTFRAVDRLVTNFHLPRSTLLMLVAAFAGYDTTMAAYRHAVAARYRFYSYGDAMCVI